MNEDVIFRYKNGRIIPIKVNKDKTTNDYMNDKIRNNKKEEDMIFYHTSNHDFSEFDNAMPRKAILGGQWGYGHYFFDNKEMSDDYGAFSKYQYQAKVNVKNWFKAKDKEFIPKMQKMGYDAYRDDIAKFLQKKGYGGAIIEHPKLTGGTWNEYVVYDSKNIKIINKREIK